MHTPANVEEGRRRLRCTTLQQTHSYTRARKGMPPAKESRSYACNYPKYWFCWAPVPLSCLVTTTKPTGNLFMFSCFYLQLLVASKGHKYSIDCVFSAFTTCCCYPNLPFMALLKTILNFVGRTYTSIHSPQSTVWSNKK